ncbi:hypothetical protein Tco_0870962 [Tanacetum coccineum]
MKASFSNPPAEENVIAEAEAVFEMVTSHNVANESSESVVTEVNEGGDDFDYVISKAETDIMRPQVHHGGFGAVAMAKGQEVDKGISVKIYLVEQVKQGQILEVNPQQTTSPSMLGDDTHKRPYASEVMNYD